MRKFWEFFFKAFTVAIVVMAGALIGQFIYEMVWGEDIIMYYSPSFTETLMGAAKAENLIFN